jgi:predicted regulator of Ras-like GTPase activity (Roadblock/LC7/MglB family)
VTKPSSPAATNLSWLIDTFVASLPGIAHTIVVSADGLPLAKSRDFPPDRADQLAAVAAGLTSLTQGAATCFAAGGVRQLVVEMDQGYLFLMSVSENSCIAALASPTCDLGLVGYEMSLLVSRVGAALTPTLRAELSGASLP